MFTIRRTATSAVVSYPAFDSESSTPGARFFRMRLSRWADGDSAARTGAPWKAHCTLWMPRAAETVVVYNCVPTASLTMMRTGAATESFRR
jgi:hypothetical protein